MQRRRSDRAIRRIEFWLLICAFLGFACVGSARAESLRLLSYNVHGAPFLANQIGKLSIPSTRIAQICPKLANFDIAMLQEDFAYHDELVGCLKGAHQMRGNTRPVFRWGYIVTAPLWAPLLVVGNKLLWPLFQGDGLTTVGIDSRIATEVLDRGRYDRCGDYLIGGNDCFAAKGFIAVRVTFSDASSVDIYNTHLEAGPEWFLRHKDQDVRRAQLEQLAAAIRTNSPDRAVIVVGDFNSDHRCPAAFEPVEIFGDALGLEDARAWDQIDARWPQLDHILYRSGADGETQLSLRSSSEDRSFQYGEGCDLSGEGFETRTSHCKALSDHPAISAEFDLTP
jgi:endonuclease/exonuclease/phosphatase family metal-dependent hydrolase